MADVALIDDVNIVLSNAW